MTANLDPELLARAAWTRCRSMAARKAGDTWESIGQAERDAWIEGAATDVVRASPYWHPAHSCNPRDRLRFKLFATRPGGGCLLCGAFWGPQDRWGGRTRINEDGTPWSEPKSAVGYPIEP